MEVFVNQNKHDRAKEVMDLISGEIAATDNGQAARADHFSKLMSDAKVDTKDGLKFVYEKMGGLIRTEVEQKKADAAKKVAQKKGKKKMIE